MPRTSASWSGLALLPHFRDIPPARRAAELGAVQNAAAADGPERHPRSGQLPPCSIHDARPGDAYGADKPLSYRERFYGLTPEKAIEVPCRLWLRRLIALQLALDGKADPSQVALLIYSSQRVLAHTKHVFQLQNLYTDMAHLVSRVPEACIYCCVGAHDHALQGMPDISQVVPPSHGIHYDDCHRHNGQCVVRSDNH